jgi:hypothetical protein
MFDRKSPTQNGNANSSPTSPTKHARKPKKPSVTILRELTRELARLAPVYRTRRAVHSAFRDYPTLDALVEALTRYVPQTKAERLALIGALIDLHRESGDRIWTTLLLRVFRPMLNKIREKLVGAPADELDAALITAFLEALRVIDTKQDAAWLPRLVRWRTRRLVFRALKAETDWEDVGFGEDCDTEADPATEGDLLLVGVWLREEHGDTESVELLRTLFEHGALWALVMKRYDGCTQKELQRAYFSLHGKRKRLIHRLRHRLRPETLDARTSQSSIPPPPLSGVSVSESETPAFDVALKSGEQS